MAKMVHTMIRVLNEQRSLDFYKQAFGLQVAERADFGDFVLIYLRNHENDFELELTVNKDRIEPYNLGDGYGHLAVVVDDIVGEHKRLEKEGFKTRDVKQFNRDGSPFAKFFFIDDPDGYKIEVIQRGGRFR